MVIGLIELTHTTVKGEPIAGTGKRNRRKGGFSRTRAGRNSGLYGALSGIRRGCTCCDYYGTAERREIRRRERAQWRAEWDLS